METLLASELQSLGVLGVKCKGYLQSVELIQRRVNVVIGLVRNTAPVKVKTLTSLPSFLTGSISKAKRQQTKLLILVMH